MASPLQPQPRRFSYAALSRYRDCPWAYYQSDVLKQPVFSAPTLPIRLGGLLHTLLAQFHQEGGPLFPMTQAALLARLDDAWARFLSEAAWFDSAEAELDCYNQLRQALVCYHQDATHPAKPYRALYVEQSFDLPLKQAGQVVGRIAGRIDRLDQLPDGSYRIIDYKLGASQPGRSVADVEGDSQLALYALACAQLTGELPVSVGFYELLPARYVDAPYQPAWGEAVLDAFLDLARAWQDQQFAPDPAHDKCRACPYQRNCPAFNESGL